jgi:hypothetical protein
MRWMQYSYERWMQYSYEDRSSTKLTTIKSHSGYNWYWIFKAIRRGPVENGPGITLDDGCVLIGEFKNEFMYKGTIIEKDIVYTGTFDEEKDQLTEGTIIYPSGLYYNGKWDRDTPQGKGIIRYTDGVALEGEWGDSWEPGTDLYHPKVKECIEQKSCVNTLNLLHPQMVGMETTKEANGSCGPEKVYCETCWVFCKRRSRQDMFWDIKGLGCDYYGKRGHKCFCPCGIDKEEQELQEICVHSYSWHVDRNFKKGTIYVCKYCNYESINCKREYEESDEEDEDNKRRKIDNEEEEYSDDSFYDDPDREDSDDD